MKELESEPRRGRIPPKRALLESKAHLKRLQSPTLLLMFFGMILVAHGTAIPHICFKNPFPTKKNGPVLRSAALLSFSRDMVRSALRNTETNELLVPQQLEEEQQNESNGTETETRRKASKQASRRRSGGRGQDRTRSKTTRGEQRNEEIFQPRAGLAINFLRKM